MPLPSPQPRAAAVRAILVLVMAVGLGGCLGRADTTGSLAPNATFASEKDLRASAEELARRFDASPADAETAVEYARTLRALGQRAQAVAVLQQAAIRNPRSLSVMAAYGKALADGGRLKEANEVLSRAHHPERPDWRILSVQGAVADQMGDFEGAQRYYEAALRIAPGEPSVLSNKGLSYALAKRLSEAEAILRTAGADRRADARVRQNLALVLGLQGKFAEADTVLKQDLAPAEAAKTLASIKRMVSQPNSWKAMRQSADRNPAEVKARG